MTISKYQKLAARTINESLSNDEKIRHSLFGLSSEVGEVNGIFQKQLQGHPIDEEHLKKEIGDCMWMLAELCTANGNVDCGDCNVIFDVIDLKTEKYPDLEDIVSNEKWASGLDGYEMEGFFIGEDGSLCLADELGNYVFCPHDRFKIIILIDDQKYSFIY